MIKVLIVEDSPVVQEFLTYILSGDPEIRVVGVARNGAESLTAIEEKRPDVITMDIHMPVMDGYEATRRIMEIRPTPIVIVSGSTRVTEISSSFKAIEAGALAVVHRPPGFTHENFDSSSRELIQTVKLMSEIRVVKRTLRTGMNREPVTELSPHTSKSGVDIQIAAIGASTGGPAALLRILSALPKGLPYPILVVQHIASGFTQGFAEWLNGAARFPVRIATHGEGLLPGKAYVAPDGSHMGVSEGHRIQLLDHDPENGLRPSVACLFRTVAQVYGPHAAGVLLTGMGRDGADELKTMKARGAVTIAQDEESSIVYGMPGEAVKIGAAAHVLSPEGIAAMLADLGRRREGGCK